MSFWRLLIVVISFCLLGLSQVNAQETLRLVDPANPSAGWKTFNGQEFPGAVVDLAVDDATKYNGRPTLKLTGDFTKGGNYVEASKAIDADVKLLSIWLKYPGSNHLTVRLIDHGGQCHQINFAVKPSDEFQNLSLPVADFFAKRGQPDAVPGILKYESWGGAADGRWHGPAKSIHILIGKTEQQKVPTLWLGDVTVATEVEGAANASMTTRVPLEEVTEGEVGWTIGLGTEFPGAKAETTVVPDAPDGAKASLKLAADFTGGGAYVDVEKDLSSLGLTDFVALRVMAKTENVKQMSVRFIDSTGQCHQAKGIEVVADGKWHELVIKVSDVVGGEHWGGANDGKWHSPGKLAVLVVGKNASDDNKPVIQFANAVAEGTMPAKQGAVAFSNDFEKDTVGTPVGWTVEGDVKVQSTDVFKGKNALTLGKTLETQLQPATAISPTFPVTPGPWEIKLATKTDLTSRDSSFTGSATLETLDAGGAVLKSIIILEQFRQNNWKPSAKTIDIPAGATQARFVFRINKETPGTYVIDELTAAPMVVAAKDDRIQRIMFTTAQLGNLLLPADSRNVTLTMWTSKPVPDSQKNVSYVVTDYWGAEQTKPIVVTLERKGKADNHFVYEGVLDLSQANLAVGRYYEIHADVAREGTDPFRNYTSLAILPEAPANAFKPEEIPFTSRNWDNRLPEYIRLTHRLGIRIAGCWGGWSQDPPYEPYAPQIELIRELKMGVLTGTPAHAIEQRSENWQKWDETALRQGVRNWVAKFGDVRPLIFNLGNEPGNRGDNVKPEVNAYRILYDEIKKIDPTITVVGTSAGPEEDFFKAGFGEWCDAYDFHVYEDALGVRRTLTERYPALFVKYGFKKPIWSTELGLNSQGLARQTVASEVYKKFTNFFAAGGTNVSWFGLLYPDKNGTEGDTFGSAHNVFDCRYMKYAPKLDAVAYYNAVNTILDKKIADEKTYDGNLHAFLFRNAAGDSLQVYYKDKGRQDSFIPLEGVNEVNITRIDGSRSTLDASEGGVTLTLNEDPILITYTGGAAKLPDALGQPVASLKDPTDVLVRTAKATLAVATREKVSLKAQPFWTVEQSPTDEVGVVNYSIGAPMDTTIREADMVVTITNAAGKNVGELYYRPAVTGAMTIKLMPMPVTAGKEPAVKVVVHNNGSDKQEVSWEVTLIGEQSIHNGEFSTIDPSNAYFTDTPSGVITVDGGKTTEVVLPLTNADRYKVYRMKASIKDPSGRVMIDERSVGGFVGVPKAAEPVKLDGSLDDAIWLKSDMQKLDKAEQFFAFDKPQGTKATWNGPQDLSANIRFAWDDNYLYVGVEVTDDIFGKVDPKWDVWQQDGLQFLIDPMRTSAQKVGKYDYGIGDRPEGPRATCFLSADSGVPMGNVPDIKVATKHGENGNVTYEIAFPWKTIAPFKPFVGADLGLTMIVNEDDGFGRDSFMTWFGNAHNKDIDKVGDLLLTE